MAKQERVTLMLRFGKRITVLFLILVCSFFSAYAAESEYSVLNNDYVRILGRGEIINENTRTFNWPNAGFEFEFSGTKAEVYVDRATVTGTDKDINGSYFNTAVYNGDLLVRVERIKLEEGWNVFYEEKNGDPETKKIMLVRSSEACRGTVSISKLRCDGTPKASQPRKKRIEFIGDSYTAGFGNSPALSERNIYCAKNTDNWNSYTGIVARNYNADNNVIAYQGKGVYANCKITSLDDTMLHQFDYEEIYVESASMNMSTREKHIFYNYQPHLVTIWLGTNDAAVPVEQETFKTAYNKLLTKVRNSYPDAVVLNIVLENSIYLDTISQLVNSEERGEKNKYHMLVLNNFTSINLGHPDIAEDNRIAQQIINKIESIDGIWDEPVYNEEKNENISLRVDYNTGRVSVYGNTNKKNDYVSAVVMKPGKTIANMPAKDDIAYIGQVTANKAGEFSFDFTVERLAGEYVFYLNSYRTESLNENRFVLKNIIPAMEVTSSGKTVHKLSDLSENRELTAKLGGFEIKESNFKGMLVIAQYENQKLTTVDFADAFTDTQNFGTEVSKGITVNKQTDLIKVFYWDFASLVPVIGEYTITN